MVDGAYTIAADNGEHTIVITDKAGNKTEYTITVYKVIPNEDVPETGDNNQIMLWSSLSLISLLVIVCLLLFGKKLLYKGKSDK